MTITLHEDLTPTHGQGGNSLIPKQPAESQGPRTKSEVPEFLPYGPGIDGETITEENLRDVRTEVDNGLEQLGFDEEVRDAAKQVVDELATNAARRGLKEVVYGVSTEDPEAVVIEVQDTAPGFTDDAGRMDNPETGRGTTIVKELAAESGYEPVLDPDGNEVGKKVWAKIDPGHLQQEPKVNFDDVSEEDLLDKFGSL